MSKNPAFQFYPGDWQHDSSLRSCSLGARGLWIEMICVMHQATPYGYFLVNQNSPGRLTCCRLFGCTEVELDGYLRELEDAGVFSKDHNGSIFSRRMIKDENLRKVRREAGSKGGNPKLLDKILVNQRVNQNSVGLVNQIPTPSSSSSSSNQKQKIEPPTPPLKILLPEGLSETDWQDFIEHRKKINKPLGLVSAKRIIAELARLKNTDEDVSKVIDQSIVNGWAGVFPVQKTKGIAHGQKKSSAQEHYESYVKKCEKSLKNRYKRDKERNLSGLD